MTETPDTGTGGTGTNPTADTSPDAQTAAAAEALKKDKKRKRKEAEAARIAQAREAAVAEAEAKWRADQESARPSVGEYLNPRKHPLVTGLLVLCVAALTAMTVLAVLFAQRDGELDDLQRLDRDKLAAETVAGKYAVDAATFDHQNLQPWLAALKNGTAEELDSRFDVAYKTLSPLILEVQWSQTAELIAAKNVDVRGDRQFVVQVFVSTRMTSNQNMDGLNTVTPYTITLDRDADWLITDVAGIAGVAQDGSTGTGLPSLEPTDQPPATDQPVPTTEQPVPTP